MKEIGSSSRYTVGFDALSSVLVFAMYHLIANPDVYDQLRKELDKAFGPTSAQFSHAVLSGLPFLNAVVKESLRLGSPFPGLARVTPPSGAILLNQFVPGGTIVSVPVYALHVSPKHFFPKPTEFLPQRWFPRGLGDDTHTDESALITFSFGVTFVHHLGLEN